MPCHRNTGTVTKVTALMIPESSPYLKIIRKIWVRSANINSQIDIITDTRVDGT